jgi:outer membrane protein
MQRPFRTLVLAAIAAVAVVAAPAAQAETLADALVAAYRTSNLLEQNRATLRAADEDVAGAVAALRPVLSWAAAASYRNADGIESDSATLSLNAQMTLLDFGRNKIAVEAAKEAVLATRESLLAVEQDVLLAAIRAYTNVKSTSENVAINQNSVRVIGEELRAANDRFSVGEVTRTDVALAEARLAAARAGLAAAQGALASAREAYKASTGAYPGSLAPLPAGPRLPATLAEAIATAQRTHPSIRQAQRQVTLAELQVTAAATERMPTLSGTASVSRSDTGGDTSTLGLSMSQTIYSGGRLSSAHRKALAGRDRARAGLLQTTTTIGQNAANSWASIEVARAQIRAIEQQVSAATVAYNGIREEATLGARTTLDVLDAEQELLNAQVSRAEAERNAHSASFALLAAIGLLTPEAVGVKTLSDAAP